MLRCTGPCLLVLAAIALLPAADAGQSYLATLIDRAGELRLADDPYWRRLVYYVPARSGSGWRSEATGADFFNSPVGREDPAAELEATLRALFEPAIAPGAEDNGRQHPQCAFIARYHWLRERLDIDDARLVTQPCERFSVWFEAIDPAHVALVFAADYVGNPSSAFGHTLLRLDRPAEDASRLVSYAVNYAAAAGAENPVSFAWKGLTGGYSGYFSLMPYYDKVREYNDLESRDLWEYELNLSTDEIRRMMMHLWEVGSVPFDYYFLRENCSYRLLGLLEAARPGTELAGNFRYWAIPTDTVRAVLDVEGLLRAVAYRPSAERRLKHSAQLASREARSAALSIADGGDAPTLPPAAQAHALELAHDYLHYEYLSGRLPRDVAAQRMHRLLVERSRIDGQPPVPEPPPYATRPDQGHPTARAGIGAGVADDSPFTELQFRTAYHDLADPWAGYRRGTQVDFLDGSVRYDHDRDRWDVERLEVIEIWSLAPRNAFLRPVSWKIGGGLTRYPLLNGEERPLVGEIQGGAGFAYGVDKRESLVIYGMLDGQLIASHHTDSNIRLGAGPRIGLVFGGGPVSLHATAVVQLHTDDEELRREARLEQSLSLHPAFALRLQLAYVGEGGRDYRESLLLAHWYF